LKSLCFLLNTPWRCHLSFTKTTGPSLTKHYQQNLKRGNTYLLKSFNILLGLMMQIRREEKEVTINCCCRGMAVEDPEAPHGLRLRIKDYPYAVDGLEVWYAIESWVRDYIFLFYKIEEDIQTDTELQAWWKEVREEGHGDKKSEPWWPKMQTREELVESCTIIIWVASALHAAVNFGQYPVAGYLPNRPTISRQYMPKENTPEFEELEKNPDKVFLKTITAQLQTLLGISLIEILSTHSSDEVYLGQRDSKEWAAEKEALEAFEKFGEKVKEIEKNIDERNDDETLKNRTGLVKMPYTLLFPSSEGGVTGRGIPNSVSI